MQDSDTNTGNAYENYVTTAKTSSVTSKNENSDSNGDSDENVLGIALIVIGTIIVVLLVVIAGLLMWNKKASSANKSVLGIRASVELACDKDRNTNTNTNNGVNVDIADKQMDAPPMKIKKSSDGMGVYASV